MAATLPFLIDPRSGPLDHSEWNFTAVKKPQGAMTSNSYVNMSATSRKNPRFQFHTRLRVKHTPSPGQNKTIETHPDERVNVEVAIPRAFSDIHEWFNSWDARGVSHTFQNQKVIWPKKRPKKEEDLIAEGLFRPSITDNAQMVQNGWDPALRLKAIPPGPPEKPNRKPTRVYVVNGDGTMREGTIADISMNDDIVASVDVEGWWGSKDSSGYTYRIDECAVYKPEQRPSTCQLRSVDGDGPIVKRGRTETNTTTEETTGTEEGSGEFAQDVLIGVDAAAAAAVTNEDAGEISEEEGF